jgi:hypothetical protein
MLCCLMSLLFCTMIGLPGQVLFFDSHEPSALVDPYSLFSPRREVQRTLHESNWSGKRVCFRDAIFPFEGDAHQPLSVRGWRACGVCRVRGD